jgi:hypothetical protein
MVVLLSAAFLTLGLINVNFGRGWWLGQLARLVLGVPLVLAYCYLAMPPLVFPQAFTLLLLTLFPNVGLTLASTMRTMVLSRRIVSLRRTPVWPPLVALTAVLLYTVVLVALPIVDASGLRDLVHAEVTSVPPPGADVKHMRVVPREAAIFSGDKVLGQLGAYYRVGAYTVQSDAGKLVWVAPLDYQGVLQWLVRRSSPGVVIVSAENPDEPAELRQREPMRYIPSALFNENLARHVYLRYGTEQLLETTLQLDGDGNPRYVVTMGRPTIGWSGHVVTAVVIVDPSTGAMQRVPASDFASLPTWLSRVYPDDIALEYNDWFGRYVHGWWNSVFVMRDVHLPARDEVYGMQVEGGHFVWFVDHTSPHTTDDSMTGFTYMDSRTGRLVYYTSSGGQFNSSAAERSVSANPIIVQGRMIPTEPILYNLGQTTWVVPAVAENGKFQTLALVQAAGGHVIVGNTSATSPIADALASYRGYLRGSVGGSGDDTRVVGTIERLASSAGKIYFSLHGRRDIFVIVDASDPITLLARPGDEVRFTATAASDGPRVVRDFVDRSFGP